MQQHLNTTLGIKKEFGGYYKPNSIIELKSNFSYYLETYEDLFPISTGRNWGYGCSAPISERSCVIDLGLCESILEFDREHGIVTLEPGVSYQKLYEFLIESGEEWLCPVHGGGPDTSIIGNVLERGYGLTPHADHFSSMISLEALLKDGSLYKSPLDEIGQPRLSKLFRYGIGPYTNGLFTQSGLGIVTQMTIKLAKRSEHIEMFFLSIKDATDISKVIPVIKSLKTELGSVLGGINLMNKERVLSMIVDYPIEKVKNGEALSSEEIMNFKRNQQLTDWTIAGAIYGNKKIAKAARRVLKSRFKVFTSKKFFYSTKSRPYFLFLSNLLKKFNYINLHKSLEAMESAYQVLNGKPNNVALKLAYWKNENKELVLQERLNPTADDCGLIWYAPLVEMSAEAVEEYIEFIEKASRKYNVNALITLTTIDELCFDSTIPILFNPKKIADQINARNFYSYLLDEGAKKGFFPYRLNIESQKKFNIRPKFLKLEFVSDYRYR